MSEGVRTIEERLSAIEANVGLIVTVVQDIALELGIRERVRANMRRLDETNGHDTEPAPAPQGEAA
jgi:hypothetical protein